MHVLVLRRTRIYLWTGLAFLIVQWGMLARLTFWELSWDVIEPITYFLGSGSTILFYCYFMARPWTCLGQDPRVLGISAKQVWY